MISGLDTRSAQFLTDLQRIQERQGRVQREISSGIRVNRPSDEPDRVMNILQLRSEVERATAVATNLSRATAEVNTADATVGVMVQIVERARVLAAQTATGTATNRSTVALEVRQLHEQLVNLTRTMSEGRYIFSGDRDTEPLYAVDWSLAAGVSRKVAENTRTLEDVNGSRFSIARSAGEILDVRNADGTIAAGNVFNALHQLALAMEVDSQTGVQNASVLIGEAIEHLGKQVTFYGHAQNRVRDAIDLNSKMMIARKQELGQAQDTDLPEALVELNLAGVHMQAALGAQAQVPRKSLFDYIG
jgi:flagellar hook-associated protein 3 FlgL